MTESQNILTRRYLAIARQRRGKHVSAAMNQHTTTEELLEAVLSVLWLLSSGL
jgi:hypothetical protein